MIIDIFNPKFRIWDYEKKQMFYFPEIIDITEPETHNYLIDTHGSIFMLTTKSESTHTSEKSKTYDVSLSIEPVNALKMLRLFPIGTRYVYELDIIRITLPTNQQLNFIVTTKPSLFTPELPILLPTPLLLLKFIPISNSSREVKNFIKSAKNFVKSNPKSIKFELLGNIFENPELLKPQNNDPYEDDNNDNDNKEEEYEIEYFEEDYENYN